MTSVPLIPKQQEKETVRTFETIEDAGHAVLVAAVVGLGCAWLWAAYVIIKFGVFR